jgi:hypothetical protein
MTEPTSRSRLYNSRIWLEAKDIANDVPYYPYVEGHHLLSSSPMQRLFRNRLATFDECSITCCRAQTPASPIQQASGQPDTPPHGRRQGNAADATIFP